MLMALHLKCILKLYMPTGESIHRGSLTQTNVLLEEIYFLPFAF